MRWVKLYLDLFTPLPVGLSSSIEPGISALENVFLAVWDVGKDLWRQVEVLGDDRLGSVGYVGVSCPVLDWEHLGLRTKPVAEDEGGLFREPAIVEDEKELGTVGTQALKRVKNAAGEIP